MARPSYAFVRREMPNYEMLAGAGWTTPLFAYDDPRLAEQIARARAAGVQYGIWGDPGQMDAERFARHFAGLRERYGDAAVYVPDIEFIGKGYGGSQGWEYNNDLARAWQQYMGGANTALTVMPNQEDFNYEAWKGLVGEWLPQAYGGDTENLSIFDPEQVRQTLIRRGVDPNIITPVLHERHGDYWNSYQGPTSLYTYDDTMISGLPRFLGDRRTAERSGAQSASPAPAPPPTPRLSQSAEAIAKGGLRHGGNIFATAAQLKQYIRARGGNYERWAKNHPAAAAALAARSRGRGTNRVT